MKTRIVFSATLLILAGCGGGGGGDGAPPPAPASLSWGQLDTTFGTAGQLTVGAPLDGGTQYGPSRLAVSPDGSLYLQGYRELTKLDPSGVPAGYFGSGGRLALDPVVGETTPFAAPVLDEGGNAYVATLSGIRNFDPSGNLLSSFGTGGFASGQVGRHLARGPGGTLFFIASQLSDPTVSPSSFEVVKLDRDGRPVPSFGASGRALVLGGPSLIFVTSTFVDAEGNFYAAGHVGYGGGGQLGFVLKLDPAGSRVAAFNPALGGVALLMPCDPPVNFFVWDMAVDAAGNVFLASTCSGPTGGTPLVVKVDARGAIDSTFAGNTSVPALFAGGSVDLIHRKANGELIVVGARPKQSICSSEVIVAKLDSLGNAIPMPNGNPLLVLEDGFPTDVGVDGYGRLYIGAGRPGVCSPFVRTAPVVLVYRLGS